MHDNKKVAISATIIPILLQVVSILTSPMSYFSSVPKIMNLIGLPLVVVYLVAADDKKDEDGMWIFILLCGLLTAFYRGILSISVISEEFMISMRLMIQALWEMIPFLWVLFS